MILQYGKTRSSLTYVSVQLHREEMQQYTTYFPEPFRLEPVLSLIILNIILLVAVHLTQFSKQSIKFELSIL